MTDAEIDGMLAPLPAEHATRWCESPACCCMGCANRHAGLEAHGVTKEQWQRAMERRKRLEGDFEKSLRSGW